MEKSRSRVGLIATLVSSAEGRLDGSGRAILTRLVLGPSCSNKPRSQIRCDLSYSIGRRRQVRSPHKRTLIGDGATSNAGSSHSFLVLRRAGRGERTATRSHSIER